MIRTSPEGPGGFLNRLRDGAPIDLVWLALGSPALAEAAVHAAPSALVLDRQHGLWERTTLEAAIGVARQRLPVIVRCAENSAVAISEALDAGASSVLVPLIESAEGAARAVSYGRYPPLGMRSAGGVRPLLRGVDRMLDANHEIAIGVMIETVAGVEAVEAIAATPGLDYLFIGTGDLAMSRGNGNSAQLAADCQRVLQAARANDIPCGIFTGTAADAALQYAKGFQVTVIANDIDIVKSGFLSAVEVFVAATAGKQ
jgi:2-keto-3-deoxy-L-rhamnonate aldolase RhmA